MNLNMTDKHYLVEDALMDCLRGLNVLTDMNDPDTCKIYNLSESIAHLQKTLHYMDKEDDKYEHHESWGEADAEARKHFERLEKVYMRFWKYAAEYEEHPSEALKEKVLMYFKEQMDAHDEIAEFVKGNCPVLCPEIGEILKEWSMKKHSAKA